MDENSTSSFSSPNASFRGDCIQVRYSDMDYIPWNNPNNLISAQTENNGRQFKNSLLVLLFFIGGPANVINMAVFYRQSLKDRVNLCLFSLALADEIYLVAAMFVHGESFYLQFTSKGTFGPVTVFILNNNMNGFLGFGFASYVMSSLIACERCSCVLSPLKYATFMQTRTMAGIIVSLLTLVVGLFFLVAFRYTLGCAHDAESGGILITTIVGEFYRQHKDLINYLDVFFFGICVSGGTVLVVTTTTILTTVKLHRIMTWRTETTSALSSREIGLTKMLIGNSIFFLICVTPSFLFRFSCLFLPEMNAERRYQNFYFMCLWIGEAFSYINSSFNIGIYYVMGSRYRETFWTLFGRRINSKSGK